jgi:hypothetical protein
MRPAASPRIPNCRYTRSARHAESIGRANLPSVVSRIELARVSIGYKAVMAQLEAQRWQQQGCAIVRHNGPLTRAERWHVARINCGPRAVFTSFTAAEILGLRGWERDEVHVLVPVGTRTPPTPGVVMHRHRAWGSLPPSGPCHVHAVAAAVVIAASSFRSVRPAVGILAAAVQQGVCGAPALHAAVTDAVRTRHRAAMLGCLADIAQGAQALSEIDFARLCRAFHLPEPERQAVRIEPNGRRRYLDAEWVLSDGRRVAAEVDGALHLEPQRWYDDQLRQNEVVLGGTLVLRFPSWLVRSQPEVVARQLRRALTPHRFLDPALGRPTVDRDAHTAR